MQKILIFGNSGSGKSTLAKQLKIEFNLAHLDLDTLAWQDRVPPQRKPLQQSAALIKQFADANPSWIIEGCYSDLLELVIHDTNEMVFLNPGTEICINNCKKRPWEPHKYASKKKQDKNLKMLINWIKDYSNRTDEFSLTAHQRLFDSFIGKKTEYNSRKKLKLI